MARVVMFVLNDCRTDARVLREADTLAAAGHEVTIVARTTDPYAPGPEEELRGAIRIVRVPVAVGALARLLEARRPGRLARSLGADARRRLRAGPSGIAAVIAASVVGLVLAPFALAAAAVLVALVAITRAVPAMRWVWSSLEWRLQWRFGVTPWTVQAVAAAPPADVCHAHDLRALPPALAAARARRDRPAPVVYDSHEIFVEAGANAARPARARAALRRIERRLAADAAVLVTVNDDLAAVLAPALGFDDRVVVVRNCPTRWDPVPGFRSPLRAAVGLGPDVPLVLAHGAFVAHRGFEILADALKLPELAGVHAAFLGRGPLDAAWRRLAEDPALGGRLHVLAAVPPDELLAWVHGADVVAVPIQPTTLNHRLSTPNKLFEALGAGVPVVASDFAPMRRVVLGDPLGPLGAVCDPADPAALARALRSVLGLPPAERADLRARCLRAAHERYAWEIDAARLVSTYARLAAEPPAGSPA